ncbi:MAG: molecular chaperone GrpE [Actinomycetota bacterium]|nr:molecular chaperone GrpE [Actinomycetota bacterium]
MEPVPNTSSSAQEEKPQRPVIRDRRRIDPDTGKVRRPAHVRIESEGEVYVPEGGTGPAPAAGASGGGFPGADGRPSTAPGGSEPGTVPVPGEPVPAGQVSGESASGTAPAQGADPTQVEELARARAQAEEHRCDLKRVQAEYVNYRRRVDRDREVAGQLAVAALMESLLPVLDDIHLARAHGDLVEGPFVAIVDKLEATLGRHGLERYGEPGEVFDPKIHEALLHITAELAEGTTETTVVQVMQPGYRAGDRVLRAARVAVADPQ